MSNFTLAYSKCSKKELLFNEGISQINEVYLNIVVDLNSIV